MQRFILAALLVCVTASTKVQVIQAQSVFGSAGATVSGGSITNSFTLGQPFVGSVSGGGMAMTIGFWGSHPGVVGVEEAPLPVRFALGQNTPNPFDRRTTIRFDIPKGQAVPVTLAIYNVSGRCIATLVDGSKPSGFYRITWDRRADNNQFVASGLYFYRLDAGSFTQTRKLLVLN
ncbi:MAG: T9SS type A sorting domain-containing protein [Candidatus Kerfeldbacteria bacterium]|nr:T9SS type A sorting domain-containing protein [Candidatus Kerfeldbacteria bacterium]